MSPGERLWKTRWWSLGEWYLSLSFGLHTHVHTYTYTCTPQNTPWTHKYTHKIILLKIFVFLCLRILMHTWAHLCVAAKPHIGCFSQLVSTFSLPFFFSSFFLLRQDLLLKQELTELANLGSQQALGILCLPSARISGVGYQALSLCDCLGLTQVLMPTQQTPHRWRHPSSMKSYFWR